MSDLSRPLYTLSIGEYIELQKETVIEQLRHLSCYKQHSNTSLEQDIIFIDQVCRLTGYTKPTLYSKVSRYEIPVLSRGKPLTFSKKAILNWIENGKPSAIYNSITDDKY